MGTSTAAASIAGDVEDHPHAYGDKLLALPIPQETTGSSPRVWGQVRNSVLIFTISRIIPTRMGTRTNINFTKFCVKDHPHAYGDKNIITMSLDKY